MSAAMPQQFERDGLNSPRDLPVLVRDLAEVIGSDVPTVCKALVALGFPQRSTNMAVGGEEALAVAAHIKAAQQMTIPSLRKAAMAAADAMDEAMKYVRSQSMSEALSLRAIDLRDALAATPSETLARFCPGCGSVGSVPENYRDCCPDGNQARMVPESLAKHCHDLFQLAIKAAIEAQHTPKGT